jgi:hypothetical protein
MNRRILPSLLLAVLLWVAQAGAAAHALSHLEDQPDSNLGGGTCVWCPAFAGLTGPPPHLPATQPVPAPRVEPAPAASAAPILLRLVLAYRSQAPPLRS